MLRKSARKSLKGSKCDSTADEQCDMEEVALLVAKEIDSQDTSVVDADVVHAAEGKTVTEDHVDSNESAAGDMSGQCLRSTDESETCYMRLQQGKNVRQSVDNRYIDTLSGSSARNEVASSSIQQPNAQDSQPCQHDSQNDMLTEDDVCSEESDEECVTVAEHSEPVQSNTNDTGKLPTAVTVNVDVHAGPSASSPLVMSPVPYSDTSSVDEQNSDCSESTQAEAEVLVTVEEVRDLKI